jgi:hypothetical protein
MGNEMNVCDYVKFKQRVWANSNGITLIGSKIDKGEQNYSPILEQNLFRPLRKETEESFKKADGKELEKRNSNPCKMQALHSSSALAVNIFQYWVDKDISIIASACGLCEPVKDIGRELVFEHKYAISGKSGNYPNIDVVIKNPEGTRYKAYAIECKFLEPYGSWANGEKGLKPEYLELGDIWRDIPETHRLAESISPDDNSSHLFHAAQLIKHILGLKEAYGKEHFRLLYLWYDVYGEESYKHRLEIEKFKSIVKNDGITFQSITYQDLIFNLHNRCGDDDVEYLNYIEQRYL